MNYSQFSIPGLLEQITPSGFQGFPSKKRKSRASRKSPSSARPKKTKMKVTPTERQKLYAWVTRIAKLMAGDSQCQYAAWFSTRYQYDKLPSGFNSEKWQSKHDEFLIERAAELQAEGFTVYIEDANSFKVNGKISHICIAGKPDIVAIKDGQVIVEDCKTGQRKAAHRMQVLIYMLLLSVAPDSHCRGLIPEGRLVYLDGVVDIPSPDVDRQFKELFRKTVALISNSQPARMAPSFWECRFCDIPAKYCPARIDSEPMTGSVEHDLF